MSAPEQPAVQAPPGAPRARSRRAWLLAAAVAAVFLMAVSPYHGPDVWHHIRCGWYAWLNGPADKEQFSCTGLLLELPWMQYEWLFQILTYLSHVHLGVGATIFIKAFLCALAFALVGLACLERGAGPEAATFAVALAGIAAAPRFFIRPDIVSFVLLALVVWAVERAFNGKLLALWNLPLAFILWANMHGAFIAGWVLLGVACGGATLDAWLSRKGLHPALRARLALGAVLVLGVAAVYVNPYGMRVLQVPYNLTRDPVIRKAVSEWAAPDLTFYLSSHAVFAPILLLACALRPRRLRSGEWLVLLFFGGLALSACRHLSVFALVTAPLLAWQMQPLFDRLQRTRRRLWASACSVCALSAATVFILHGPRLASMRLGLAPGRYPEMSADFLKAEGIAGNLFNDYNDGNYLMWALYPQNLVFIDARLDVYGGAGMRLFDDVWSAYPPGLKATDYGGQRVTAGWRETLDRFHVRVCLVRYIIEKEESLLRKSIRVVRPDGTPVALPENRPRTQPLVDALAADPHWALIFWDDGRMIFLRADETGGRHVYRTRPDTFRVTDLRTPAAVRAALSDFEHRVGLGPRFDCVTARVCLANTLQYVGRFADALPHLERAVALKPHDGDRAHDLAACLLALNRPEEAARAFRQALRLRADTPHKSWNGLGACLRELGKPREALAAFRRAVAIEPRYVNGYLSLSLACEDLGRRDDALRAVRQALQIEPRNPQALERLRELGGQR